MWFRAGSFPDDRFSVSTLKKRMRRKNKSEEKPVAEKGSGSDATDAKSASVAKNSDVGDGGELSEVHTGEKNHHTWPKVVRPPRTYKKSSSKTRIDAGKKGPTLPILDTKTTTSAATIKNSKSNTNLNINTLIKNKLNHKHVPVSILNKMMHNGEAAANGPYPLVSSKSVRLISVNVLQHSHVKSVRRIGESI